MRNNKAYDNSITGNLGFSLVELIICVSILAVATIPLMSAFTTSGHVIGKAQSMQNATSVAESVMEEIKGSTIEQIKNNTDYGYVDDVPATYSYDSFATLGPAARITYVSGKIGSNKGMLIQQDEDPFYIFFKPDMKSNAEAASPDGEKFDVIATIDATKNYSGAVGDTAADANSIELPVIERIDKGKHAVISKEINRLDASAVETWRNNYRDRNHLLLSDTVTLTSMTKEVIITISGKDADSNPEKQADVECIVRYYDSSKADFASDPCHVSEKVYSGTFLGTSDSRVYVFYKTAIQSIHSNHKRRDSLSLCPPDESVINRENIIIKSTSDDIRDKARQVYLMMQEDDEYPTSDSKYYVLGEGKTKMTITAEDGSGVALPKKATANSDLSTDGVLESSDKSLMVITNLHNNAGATGKSHFYYNKKDDYIYEIDVAVYDKNGKERAHLTSTKDAEKTPTPTPSATPSPSPTEEP